MSFDIDINYGDLDVADAAAEALNEQPLDIECPLCNFKFSINLSQLNSEITCPNCNKTIDFDVKIQ